MINTLTQKDQRIANKHRRTIFWGPDLHTAALATALGKLGWTTKAIAAATGYTAGQTQYRLTWMGVKRSSYRDGTSPEAHMVARKLSNALLKDAMHIASSKHEAEQQERFATADSDLDSPPPHKSS